MFKNRSVKPFFVSVASGKGGVGKTLTTVSSALSCQRQGYKTLVIDGDLGMANVDVILGLKSRYSIEDVLADRARMQDVALTGPSGIVIIPSGSGLAQLADLKLTKRIQLIDRLSEYADQFDMVFIDTGAGIGSSVLHLNAIADEVVLVTTPEPHALTDAYAFAKAFQATQGEKNFNLVVNQVISEDQGLKIFQRLADTLKRFLSLSIELGAIVPRDPMVERSVMMQRAASEEMTHTRSGQAWNELAHRLIHKMTNRKSSIENRGFRDLMIPQIGPGSRATL